MKITNVSCSQFAGIKERDVSFDDGINVVFGKNESGKSTLVELISRTLFQNVRLDKRKDKAFISDYFPSERRDGSEKGDYIDGKLTFSSSKGRFMLSKEWGSDSRCVLTVPSGDKIRDQKKIDSILQEELLYGEGVYSEILMSSRSAAEAALKTILDPSVNTDAKKEIVDAASKAFLETGGVSIDEIGEAIDQKIAVIEGKHWDRLRSVPAKKQGGGDWAVGLGEIHKAYYAMIKAKSELDEINELQNRADKAAALLKAANESTKEAEEQLERFNEFFEALNLRSRDKKELARVSADLKRATDALSDWPEKNDLLDKAHALYKEMQDRELLDKYESVKTLADKIDELKSRVGGRSCPTDTEIRQVRTAQRKAAELENKLCGMNISAAVKLFGDNEIIVRSVRTGELVDISNGKAELTEAVTIAVPGVMEMQLSPADVDVDMINKKTAEQKEIIENVFTKHSVKTSEELEELAKELKELGNEIGRTEERLVFRLGDDLLDDLASKAGAVSGRIRPKQDIAADIRAVCGGRELSRFIAEAETITKRYTDEYGSIIELKGNCFELYKRKDELESSLQNSADIPVEYVSKDPEAYRKELIGSVEKQRSLKEAAVFEKSAAFARTEGHSLPDTQAKYEAAERVFAEQKTLLDHWVHIKSVYEEKKQSIDNDPLSDIGQSFAKYLAMISDNKVGSELPESGRLDMNIYSSDSLVDYSKLSEGTKETVSLAFRLAVLDHLFPDGGGMIVFDDPFANMDSERTARSCELVNECAKKNQVIFLTCSESYIDLLGGNLIRIDSVI